MGQVHVQSTRSLDTGQKTVTFTIKQVGYPVFLFSEREREREESPDPEPSAPNLDILYSIRLDARPTGLFETRLRLHQNLPLTYRCGGPAAMLLGDYGSAAAGQ